MKDIPIEEAAAISPEIHEAAARLGCTHVSVTGQIWPGGRTSGPPEEAARFFEYSWWQAAAVNGRATLEETDATGFHALLVKYGLAGDTPTDAPAEEPEPEEAAVVEKSAPDTSELTVSLLPATKRELERQARAEGLSVGEYLDWKFQPRPEGRR